MAAPTIHADDKTVDSFTIRGTNHVVRATTGDCVLIRPSWCGEEQLSSVARVEKLEKCCESSGVAARIRWYYSPQETKHGRLSFHGEKELCLTDHLDTRSAHTIVGKYTVHSLTEYAELTSAWPEDFFCRYEYEVANASISFHAKHQYCYCEAPYNPDIDMLFCYAYRNLFHPYCVNMDIRKAREQGQFACPSCVQRCGLDKILNAHDPRNTMHGNIVIYPCVPRESAPIRNDEYDGITKKGEQGVTDASTAIPHQSQRHQKEVGLNRNATRAEVVEDGQNLAQAYDEGKAGHTSVTTGGPRPRRERQPNQFYYGPAWEN